MQGSVTIRVQNEGDPSTATSQREVLYKDTPQRRRTTSQKNMASELTLPKVKPFDVVRQALSAVEAGRDEVLSG